MLDFRNHPSKFYNPFEHCNLLAGDPSLFHQLQIYLVFMVMYIICTNSTFVIYLPDILPNKASVSAKKIVSLFPLYLILTLFHVSPYNVSSTSKDCLSVHLNPAVLQIPHMLKSHHSPLSSHHKSLPNFCSPN